MKLPWIIGIVIASTMIVSGCSIDWNDEKDRKIAELNERISKLESEKKELADNFEKSESQAFKLKEEFKQDAFEKKQECSKFFHDYEKYLRSENPPELFERTLVLEIFYSSKMNTCIWSNVRSIGGKIGNIYFIDDLFTRSSVNNTEGLAWWDEDAFNKKIQELKWE